MEYSQVIPTYRVVAVGESHQFKLTYSLDRTGYNYWNLFSNNIMSIRLQSPPESWQSAYIEYMIIITLGLSIIFIDSVFMIISTMESTFAWPPLHAHSYPLPTPFDGLVHAQQAGLYDVSVTEFHHSYYSLLAHTFDCFCRFILIALYIAYWLDLYSSRKNVCSYILS